MVGEVTSAPPPSSALTAPTPSPPPPMMNEFSLSGEIERRVETVGLVRMRSDAQGSDLLHRDGQRTQACVCAAQASGMCCALTSQERGLSRGWQDVRVDCEASGRV